MFVVLKALGLTAGLRVYAYACVCSAVSVRVRVCMFVLCACVFMGGGAKTGCVL